MKFLMVLIAIVLARQVFAGQLRWQDEPLQFDQELGCRIGLWSLEDTPAIEGPGWGASYIRGSLKLDFASKRSLSTLLDDGTAGVYVVLAHTDDLEGGSIGLRHLAVENSHRGLPPRAEKDANNEEGEIRETTDSRSTAHALGRSGVRIQSLCCTRRIIDAFDALGYNAEHRPAGCQSREQIDSLLINDGELFAGRIWHVTPSSPRLSFEYETGRRSGIYYLYLVDCFDREAFDARVRASGILLPDDDKAEAACPVLESSSSPSSLECQDVGNEEHRREDVRVSGQLTWMNPYGHLSADVYPLMPFFGVMTCAYLMLGIAWLAVCARNLASLMVIQVWVAAVIAFGMIESAVWYYDYHCENQGDYLWTVTVSALICSGLKRAVSRIFFLIIAMGYGVHRPTLGSIGYRVAFLGALYFVCSICFSIADQMHKRFNSLYFKAVADTFVFPVAMLDCFLYWWTFVSLSATLTELAARNKFVKFRMHRRLYLVLVGAALLSAAVIVYEVWAMFVSSVDDRWRTWWIWEAFWSVLFLAMLTFVAYTWSPGATNAAAAFSSSSSSSSSTASLSPSSSLPSLHVDHVDNSSSQDRNNMLLDSVVPLEPSAVRFHQSKMQ